MTRVIYVALSNVPPGSDHFSRLEDPPDDLQISEVSQFGAGGP